MSNDPKDAVVDLSKMMTGQPATPTQTIPVSASPSMITPCNEGANLIGVETSTQYPLVGHENFSKDEAGKEKP